MLCGTAISWNGPAFHLELVRKDGELLGSGYSPGSRRSFCPWRVGESRMLYTLLRLRLTTSQEFISQWRGLPPQQAEVRLL